MARSTNIRLRGLWFQVHKWIGLTLAILIIPISVTGSALVWDEPLDQLVNPQRYDVAAKSEYPPWRAHRLQGPPSLYEHSARRALGADALIVSIRYPQEIGPVVVTALDSNARLQSGPPPRVNVWLDPSRIIRSPDHFRVAVLDTAPANAGLVRFLHVLHGSLQVPGLGRQIVGWIGVFMFISCLTGLWLWWPVTGSVRRGFRWKRQNSTNANLHHQMGFWILLPLAMLSFTGAWISFPGLFSRFEAGAAAPMGGAPIDRARAARAGPIAHPNVDADVALNAARTQALGPILNFTWPTDQSPNWKIVFADGPTEVEVDSTTGEAKPPRPPAPETRARLMRRLHDGAGMGAVWQAIVFLGGIVPAILAVTGIVMWLRSRGWRAKLARRRKAGQLSPQPAE